MAIACLRVSVFFGRPPTRPRARAAASPAKVRSRINARSNSASEAKMWKMSLPPAVVLSMFSARLLKPRGHHAPRCEQSPASRASYARVDPDAPPRSGRPCAHERSSRPSRGEKNGHRKPRRGRSAHTQRVEVRLPAARCSDPRCSRGSTRFAWRELCHELNSQSRNGTLICETSFWHICATLWTKMLQRAYPGAKKPSVW